MGAALGQPFVVENRTGAAGTIGARSVAKAPPDGYTLMVGHSGVFAIAPSLYAKPGYDPRKDFVPIGLIGSFQQVLAVQPARSPSSLRRQRASPATLPMRPPASANIFCKGFLLHAPIFLSFLSFFGPSGA